MLYSYFVKKLIRQSFDHVNNHRWDELLKAVAPNIHHAVNARSATGPRRQLGAVPLTAEKQGERERSSVRR